MKRCNHIFKVKEVKASPMKFGYELNLRCKCGKEVEIFEGLDHVALSGKEEEVKNRIEYLKRITTKEHEDKLKFDIAFYYKEKKRELVEEKIGVLNNKIQRVLDIIVRFTLKGITFSLYVLFVIFILSLFN